MIYMSKKLELITNDRLGIGKEEMHERYRRSGLTNYSIEEIEGVMEDVNELNEEIKVFYNKVFDVIGSFLLKKYPVVVGCPYQYEDSFNPYFEITNSFDDWHFVCSYGKKGETYPLTVWRRKISSHKKKLKKAQDLFDNIHNKVIMGIYPDSLI